MRAIDLFTQCELARQRLKFLEDRVREADLNGANKLERASTSQ